MSCEFSDSCSINNLSLSRRLISLWRTSNFITRPPLIHQPYLVHLYVLIN
jgi:hypothetical protein